MRMMLFAALFAASAAQAHDGLTIEENTGLKSEAVILNDLRLRGVAGARVSLRGDYAQVSAVIRGQSVTLQIDRRTGDTRQLQGAILSPDALGRDLRLVPQIRPELRLDNR